ncbi:MAG: cupin domain-containing protein [Candidatus Acidiferrum sp.]
MEHFPDFMKSAANKISTSSQSTPGVEGYVYDGVDGSQMAFWTCRETAHSAPHVHHCDEYMVVVQGCYTLIFGDRRIPVKAGEEYFIPRGLWHGGEVVAGTRTIHAFGGQRAQRNHQ